MLCITLRVQIFPVVRRIHLDHLTASSWMRRAAVLDSVPLLLIMSDWRKPLPILRCRNDCLKRYINCDDCWDFDWFPKRSSDSRSWRRWSYSIENVAFNVVLILLHSVHRLEKNGVVLLENNLYLWTMKSRSFSLDATYSSVHCSSHYVFNVVIHGWEKSLCRFDCPQWNKLAASLLTKLRYHFNILLFHPYPWKFGDCLCR
jgi:hypothetical protein